MYSQYSYSHGAQQPHMSKPVTQHQQTWNGREWVNDSNAGFKSTGVTYQQSQYSSHHQIQNSSSTLQPQQGENTLDQYKHYLKYWLDQAKSQRMRAASLPPSAEKNEAIRVAAWAEYYASQSANAMKYYENPKVSSTTSVREVTNHTPLTTAPLQRIATTPAVNKKVSNRDEYPPSLKRYTAKVLSKYSSNHQRQLAQTMLEKMVKNAIENNTIFKIDWDSKSLPDIPNQSVPSPSLNSLSDSSSLSYSQSLKNSLSATVSVHRQSKAATKKSNPQLSQNVRNKVKNKAAANDVDYIHLMPENDSYYGHSAAVEGISVTNSLSKRVASKKKKSQNFHSQTGKKSKTQDTRQFDSSDEKSVDASADGFERSSRALARRANRFSSNDSPLSVTSSEPISSESKLGQYMGMSLIGGSSKTRSLDKLDYEHMTVKGTCQKLEKNYFRLNGPPKPEIIRPRHILDKHLKKLKRSWGNGKCEYEWLCSQLKAIRQDLTVQRINDDFAVEVYETHARVALEQADLNEYNQCQTQLKELYESLQSNGCTLLNENEFIAYRIIYYVFLTGNKKYDGGSTDLLKIMLSLTSQQIQEPCIAHALRVRVAVMEHDYHAFFQLHRTCPKMGAYLMDFMVDTVRFQALQRISKAYRPSVPVEFVMKSLGFDLHDKKSIGLGLQWLGRCGFSIKGSDMITKGAVVQFCVEDEKKNSLI